MPDNDRNELEFKTPFFSSKIAGKNLTLRDIVLFLVFVVALGTFFFVYSHAQSAEKATGDLLREVKQSNKEALAAQRSTAYYQCRTACLIEQRELKTPSAQLSTVCDNVCAPVKQ